MPSLPIYVAQQQAQGSVPGATPGVIDLRAPISMAMHQAGRLQAEADREAERIRLEQERQQKQLEHDEARTFAINAESRLQMRLAERLAQAQQQPDGMVGITAAALKDFDGWVKEEEQQAPTAARPMITGAFARMRGETNLKLFNAETRYRQEKVVNDFGDGLDADRRVVFADPTQFQPAMARRIALARTLEIPESARAKLVEQSREGLAFDAASALAERDPDGMLQRAGVAGAKTGKDGRPLPSDPARAAEAVQADPILSNLSPDRLRTVVDRATMLSVQRKALAQQQAEHAARQAEVAAARREREASQAYTILSDWTRNGLTADPVASKPLLDRIAGTPYQAAYQALAGQVAANTAAASLPIAAQRAQLDSLKARRNEAGTSQQLEHEITARERILSSTVQAYDADPLRAGAERGVIKALAPLNVTTLDSAIGGLTARVAQASSVQVQAGRPVSPFTVDEAAKVGDMLAALPMAERSRRVAQLAASMQPGQAQALAAQIDKRDRALGLEIAAGSSQTNTGRFASEWIARGAQAVKDKAIKEDAGAMTGLRAQIATEVGDSLSGRAREDVIDAARFMYLGQQAAGLSPSPAGVVKLALGGDLLEYNGRRIPVPAGWGEPQMRTALRNAAPAVQQQAADGTVYLGSGKSLPVADFVARLPDAQLEPVGAGRYAVRTGGALATNASRQPIVIEVR